MLWIHDSVREYAPTGETWGREARPGQPDTLFQGGIFAPYVVLRRPLPHREDRCPLPYCNRPRDMAKPSYESRGVDYSSHAFCIARMADDMTKSRDYYLLINHGGGRGVIRLHAALAESVLDVADDVNCYRAMHGLFSTAQDVASAASHRTAGKYRRAFVEGRLKKRKVRGEALAKVWIEPPPLPDGARSVVIDLGAEDRAA